MIHLKLITKGKLRPLKMNNLCFYEKWNHTRAAAENVLRDFIPSKAKINHEASPPRRKWKNILPVAPVGRVRAEMRTSFPAELYYARGKKINAPAHNKSAPAAEGEQILLLARTLALSLAFCLSKKQQIRTNQSGKFNILSSAATLYTTQKRHSAHTTALWINSHVYDNVVCCS